VSRLGHGGTLLNWRVIGESPENPLPGPPPETRLWEYTPAICLLVQRDGVDEPAQDFMMSI